VHAECRSVSDVERFIDLRAVKSLLGQIYGFTANLILNSVFTYSIRPISCITRYFFCGPAGVSAGTANTL
jgi:hypothetical protein